MTDTIAMVYDFDGTLTPLPMQEYTILPQLGISGQKFWKESREEAHRTGGDAMLTYMRLLVERLEERKTHLSRDDLKGLAHHISYFPGVSTWFDRMKGYVHRRSCGRVKLRNYIISAGQREILEGTTIRKHFHRIFASEYFFDHHGRATVPNVLVNDTIKTQYIFRINKGKEAAHESINEYMPEGDRPIPFANIIYIGDGMTDVPCMTVTKKNGGHAIAVFTEDKPKARRTCEKLLQAGRVDFIAPADYSSRKLLERRVRLILDMMLARIGYERELRGA